VQQEQTASKGQVPISLLSHKFW